MGFFEECKDNTRPRQASLVGALIADWPKKDVAEFNKALDDASISTAAIVKVLGRRGIKISYNALAKYRRERV